MSKKGQWHPSQGAQATQWWARLALRYVIGGGGLIYEVVFDRLRNPTALVVFGGIAGIPDVLGYRAFVKGQAEADRGDEEGS